jgi:hypothetical protein
MYIISKYKDYYDYLAQIYGVDKKVVYFRKPEIVEGGMGYSTDIRIERNGQSSLYYIYHDYIWICDKSFPVVYVRRELTDFGWFYYSYEDLIAAWPELKPRKSRFKWFTGRNFLLDHFQGVSTAKLNTKYDCPQLWTHHNNIHKDILLKDCDFQKMMSPEQVFQNVSMWVSAKPEPPQTVPTDMHRFEAKGFDKKTSFRNM